MIPDKMVWGAIVGFLSSQVLGALWYAPFLFGGPWMKATFPGKSPQQIAQNGFAIAYTFTLVSTATLALLLQFILITFLKVTSVQVAVKTGLGLGALMTLANISHLCFARRSLLAFVIDHAYDALCFAITSAAIVYFQ
ncbi:uncharacterized protein LOC124147112 isoform X1 [Haliotis rufescens]|uniref:uncharacterized protein LOC124147112 isoform X1 n=2 Tax=Haliotis rufescens TaxID=6454 RepID=UPI00201F003A|nr:uncharacterized protein LOC124147112 isoform X1 [Haliotis rufescens]